MRKPIALRSMITYIMGVPLMCVALLFIYLGYQSARQQTLANLNTMLTERTARQAADLNLYFGNLSRHADTVAAMLSATGPLEEPIYQSLLGNLVKSADFNGVLIAFDESAFPSGLVPPSPMALQQGEKVKQGIFTKQKYYDYDYRDWFLLPKLANTGMWTDPSYSAIHEGMICAYSAPFFKNKVFQGVVSFSLAVREITETLQAINMQGSQLVLLSQFGTLVVHPDSNLILRHTLVSLANERDSPALVDLAYSLRNAPAAGVARLDRGILGDNEYIAYAPVPSTKWVLLSVIPESVMLAPLMASVWHGVYLVLGASGLMFLIGYWLLTRELVTPLRRMQLAARRLATGKLRTRVVTRSRIREILSLEHAFNSMVAQLSESINKEIEAGRARSYAEEASRAKSDFLARMSHEIRTPMNAILGLTHLALEGQPAPGQHAYLQKIQRASKSMLAIINDILDFSKIEAGKLELELAPFRMEEIRHTLEDMFLAAAQEKEVDFHIQVDPNIPPLLMGDSLRLTQILLNLCNNALKFTTQGTINVRIDLQEDKDGKCVLELCVQDTGIGIPAEIQGSLFSKFSQADSSVTRRFGGTGLGLAICKLLVELMGGQISLESVLGQGSTFRVRVPLAHVPENALQPEASESETVPEISPDARILVAEDNDINQEIIVALLQNMGLGCRVVGTGKEALQALHEESFDLVLMDIQMPEMDGLTATKMLRSQNFRLPVLAMTANAMEEDKENCRLAGMNAHIAKPIDPAALQRTLAFWLSAGHSRSRVD